MVETRSNPRCLVLTRGGLGKDIPGGRIVEGEHEEEEESEEEEELEEEQLDEDDGSDGETSTAPAS